MSKKESSVLRLNTVRVHPGETEYKPYVYPDTEYVVDDSSFVPISEAVKQLASGYGVGNKNEQLYDFPDGKDTGAAIPFARSSQFKDIAELSTEVAAQTNDISKKLEEAKKMQEFDDKLKSDIDSSTPSPES